MSSVVMVGNRRVCFISIPWYKKIIASPSEQKTRSRGLCTVTTWNPGLHWQIALWWICTQSECGSLEMHVRSWKHCSPSLTAANKPKWPSRYRSSKHTLGPLAYIQLAKITHSSNGNAATRKALGVGCSQSIASRHLHVWLHLRQIINTFPDKIN